MKKEFNEKKYINSFFKKVKDNLNYQLSELEKCQEFFKLHNKETIEQMMERVNFENNNKKIQNKSI